MLLLQLPLMLLLQLQYNSGTNWLSWRICAARRCKKQQARRWSSSSTQYSKSGCAVPLSFQNVCILFLLFCAVLIFEFDANLSSSSLSKRKWETISWCFERRKERSFWYHSIYNNLHSRQAARREKERTAGTTEQQKEGPTSVEQTVSAVQYVQNNNEALVLSLLYQVV